MNVGDDDFELMPVELTEELKDVAHEPSISPDISVVYNLSEFQLSFFAFG